jgi:hypothetical protein
MRNKALTVLAVAAAVVVWIGVSAEQQEMLPRPGPGSGIIDVRGTVSIAGRPEVRIAAPPPLTIEGPTFVQKGGRYVVTWPSGEREPIAVVAVAQGGGWVRVGPSRWINLDTAREVERAR